MIKTSPKNRVQPPADQRGNRLGIFDPIRTGPSPADPVFDWILAVVIVAILILSGAYLGHLIGSAIHG